MIIYILEKSVFLYKFLNNKYNKGKYMVTSASGTQPQNTFSKAVKLTARTKKGYQSVVFNVTPELNKQRSVSYAEIGDLRLPASILIYMGSPSRRFSLNAKLLARTQADADLAFQYSNLLEAWCVTDTKPYIGSAKGGGIITNYNSIAATQAKLQDNNQQSAQQAAADQQTRNGQTAVVPSTTNPNTPPITSPQKSTDISTGDNLFYQTPQVLFLTGYGSQFRNIPVVIRDLSITFPSDVDYIKNSAGAWVPIIQDIGIGLQEARNVYSRGGTGFTGAIDTFDINAFKSGTLNYW